MDDIFDARRKRLQCAVEVAVLNLCEHMGCAGFSFQIPGTTPPVVVTVSESTPPQPPQPVALKPCCSPYCECEPGKCTRPGRYDARGEG